MEDKQVYQLNGNLQIMGFSKCSNNLKRAILGIIDRLLRVKMPHVAH
jgi:hypothetical protein